jgi:hypothetical protein
MEMKQTKVHHWRYESGAVQEISGRSIIQMDAPNRGWYCWVYPADDRKFVEWMNRMCPTADVTHRFNSGDPMYTTYISDEKEAVLFQLKWM